MANNKWVHLTFFAGGLLLAFLLTLTIEWIWGYFAKPKELWVVGGSLGTAAVVTFLAWRNEGLFTKVQEIVAELLKVTWPTRKETYAATVVVIITVIIFSMFLGFFDFVWSWATNAIYS